MNKVPAFFTRVTLNGMLKYLIEASFLSIFRNSNIFLNKKNYIQFINSASLENAIFDIIILT